MKPTAEELSEITVEVRRLNKEYTDNRIELAKARIELQQARLEVKRRRLDLQQALARLGGVK